MPIITFLPVKKTVEAQAGETILEAALRADVPIQHACGGYCACTTCHVLVKEGERNLSEIEENEEERLERADGLTLRSRLACQAKVQGDVTVEIVNIEPGH